MQYVSRPEAPFWDQKGLSAAPAGPFAAGPAHMKTCNRECLSCQSFVPELSPLVGSGMAAQHDQPPVH
jgi:hypothetical protein